jgi:hypothetical protein
LLLKPGIFAVEILFLGPATLPAISPILDQPLEEEGTNPQTRLKANPQGIEAHLGCLGMSVKKTDVARDGEKDIVVEGR